MPDTVEKTKKKIEVVIYGQTFSLLSDEPEDYVRKMAAKVDKIMIEIGKSQLPPAKCAVFTAMTIADELEKTKSAYEELSREIDSKTLDLGVILDKALDISE